MINKKSYLALSASALLLLAACGNGDEETTDTEGDTGEDTTEETTGDMDELTVWTWDPNFNVRALEMAEARYQEENTDFSLNILENSQEDVIQRLNTSLS
ncbi:hypothetical protein [Alkalibacterium sp. 20]|uniref:hypothetical protein n=1 Tax=Alkalibacterium sp. 20 TaxID=1798803 RepID=UPI0009003E90|nr:hypothetical protein [Alkalibacterium sp. 20]OJF92776.1 hypothetical protein AX762_09645 [Alkalibacterium sp. 20]